MTRPSGRGTVCPLFAFITLILLVTSSPLASVETRAYRPALTLGQEGRETGQFRQPGSVVVDEARRIYVADTYNHRIQVFDPKGQFLQTLGAEGAQPGALLRPKGLAWGPDHLLYVADTGNHRIQAFNQQGEVVTVLGAFGHLPGQFNAPEAVAVDSSNTLYIADTL
jgi:tripartite motif-containing protein 71